MAEPGDQTHRKQVSICDPHQRCRLRRRLLQGIIVSLAARIFMLIGLVLLIVAGGELANGLVLRQERLDEARRDTAALARIAELDVGRILEARARLSPPSPSCRRITAG